MSRIEALKRERDGYVRRNLLERVAQVDAELARLGVVEAAVAPAVERAVAPKPRPAARKPVGDA